MTRIVIIERMAIKKQATAHASPEDFRAILRSGIEEGDEMQLYQSSAI